MTEKAKKRPTERRRVEVTIDEKEDFERQLRASDDRRRRVVAALLALRDVKSIGMDPEPVVRTMRVQLWTLPQLADDLEFEDAEMIRQILELQIAQIFDDVEQALHALYEQPRSPALARYIAADRELRQLDLADE